MLTCLIYSLIVFFKQSKLQKYKWKKIDILLPLTHNTTNHHWTRHDTCCFSIPPTIHSFPYVSSLLLFIPSIDWFVWCKRYGRLLVITHMVESQKTTCILVRRVSDFDFLWQLTLYADNLPMHNLTVIVIMLWGFSNKVLLILTFYLICSYFTHFFIFGSSHITPIRRPYSSSSADLR